MAGFLIILALIAGCNSNVQNDKNSNVQDSTLIQSTDTITIDVKDTLPSIPFEITLDYVMGQFDPAKHPDFTVIEEKYADRAGMYLRKDVYEAFLRMYEHALRDGIRLQIRSATRNFNAQKGIWEAKWSGARTIEGGENLAETTPDPVDRAKKILRYSSMPGSSRHHWGTDIDLNNLENDWFDQGEGLTLYKWLTLYAHEYGFCQPYSADRPFGYFEERWHWTYMPVSEKITSFASMHLKDEMIKGFSGSETAKELEIVRKYVLGINENCK